MKERYSKKLVRSASQQLREAIQKGETKKALKLLKEKDRGTEEITYNLVTWIDQLQTMLSERLGEQAVYESNVLCDLAVIRRLFRQQHESIGNKLERALQVWTMYHNVDVEVKEDAEKYTLTYYCPTGGMLTSSDKKYGKTKEPHVWSQGRKDMCYFCTHCPTSFELESIDEYGVPDWITNPLDEGRCSRIMYKDPKYIPEEYYRRVGKTKPT